MSTRQLVRRPPNRSLQTVLLEPVLVPLPPAAHSLTYLLSVGRDDGAPVFHQVARASEDIDAARSRLMAQLANLPECERTTSIRISQSASLVGRMMLASARVARASGRRGPLPATCVERARGVATLTERAASAGPRQPAHRGARARPAPQPRHANILHSLESASEELDRLLDLLTTDGPHPVRA